MPINPLPLQFFFCFLYLFPFFCLIAPSRCLQSSLLSLPPHPMFVPYALWYCSFSLHLDFSLHLHIFLYIALSLSLSPPCYLLFHLPPPPLPFPPSNVLPLFPIVILLFPINFFALTLSLTPGVSYQEPSMCFLYAQSHWSIFCYHLNGLSLLPILNFCKSSASLVPFLLGCLLFVSLSFSALSLFQFLFFISFLSFPSSHALPFSLTSQKVTSLSFLHNHQKEIETERKCIWNHWREKNETRKQRETWIEREIIKTKKLWEKQMEGKWDWQRKMTKIMKEIERERI